MSKSSAVELVNPEDTQGGKEYFPSCSHSLQPKVSPEETQDVEMQDTGPRYLWGISKEQFQ